MLPFASETILFTVIDKLRICHMELPVVNYHLRSCGRSKLLHQSAVNWSFTLDTALWSSLLSSDRIMTQRLQFLKVQELCD